MISDATQTGGISNPEIAAGAQAKVDAINAAGGIDGRPVELIQCNAEGDPNAGRSCAEKMVSAGAVAVVGMATDADPTIIPVLERASLPVIGAVPTTPVSGNSRVAFCFNPGVYGEFLAFVPLLKQEGAKKVSMAYPSNVGATSAGAKAAFDLGVKQAGLVNGGVSGFDYSDTQFSAPVAKALLGGVDGMVAFAPGPGQALLISAVREQSPSVKIATSTNFLTSDVIKSLGSAGNGLLAVGWTQPASATSLPGIQMFNADMGKYESSQVRNDFAINSWASVWAFQQIARGLRTISRANVLAAMTHVHGLNLGGIYPPLSAPGRSAALTKAGVGCAMNTGVVFETLKAGNLVALSPGRFFDPLGT